VLRCDRLGLLKSQQVPEEERRASVSTITFDDVLHVMDTGKEVEFKEAYDDGHLTLLDHTFKPLRKNGGSRYVLPPCIRPGQWRVDLRFKGETTSSTYVIRVEEAPKPAVPAGTTVLLRFIAVSSCRAVCSVAFLDCLLARLEQ
jgi:hypothetical protein